LGPQVVLGNRWQAPMSRPQGQPQQATAATIALARLER
jgi:hypothetical protein